MTKYPPHKLTFVAGLVLLLVSFPLLLLLEIETVNFFSHLNYLMSDEGIECWMFSTGVGLVCIGLIIRAFSKA